MTLSTKQYDFLKHLAQVYLPALGSLYFALSGIWHLPADDQVVGTIVAIDTFLGILLKVSTNKFNDSDAATDGDILVQGEGDDAGISTIAFNKDPGPLKVGDLITLRVSKFGP